MLAFQLKVSTKKRMKTMKTINRSRKSYSILATALLLILLGGVEQAQAQWSTDPNTGNTTITSGNVGIATTNINGWWSSFRALQLGADGYAMAWSGTAGNTANDSIHLGQNSYFDGASWKYQIGSYGAANYYQTNGTHGFRVAGSGTA